LVNLACDKLATLTVGVHTVPENLRMIRQDRIDVNNGKVEVICDLVNLRNHFLYESLIAKVECVVENRRWVHDEDLLIARKRLKLPNQFLVAVLETV